MSIHWGGRGAGHVNRLPRAIGALSPFSGATMLLDFTNPVLDPRITFSRGTGATRVNASGFIEVVGTTTPRFDYDPVTLAPRGLLIEEARTNLLTQSGAIGGTGWFTSALHSITTNSIASPDGTISATLVTENTATSAHAVFGTNATLTAAAHTASVYIKAGSRRYVSLRGETISGSLYPWVTLDTQTGAINSNAAVTSASATNVGNGWYRLQLTWANTQVTAASANIVIAGSDVATAPSTASSLGNSYTGTSSTFYVWGAQLEAGAFATSYIPTVASTVSRSADVATMTGTNFSTWYNQAEGTFVADADNVATGNLYILDANDSTSNEEIRMATAATSGSLVVWRAGVVQANITVGTTAANTPFKMGAAYAANNTNAALNGAIGTTDTSFVSPTPNRLQIGASFTAYLNGHIRAIAYYNTRLPNTQLQTLTAPSLASPLALDFISPTYTVGY